MAQRLLKASSDAIDKIFAYIWHILKLSMFLMLNSQATSPKVSENQNPWPATETDAKAACDKSKDCTKATCDLRSTIHNNPTALNLRHFTCLSPGRSTQIVQHKGKGLPLNPMSMFICKSEVKNNGMTN